MGLFGLGYKFQTLPNGWEQNIVTRASKDSKQENQSSDVSSWKIVEKTVKKKVFKESPTPVKEEEELSDSERAFEIQKLEAELKEEELLETKKAIEEEKALDQKFKDEEMRAQKLEDAKQMVADLEAELPIMEESKEVNENVPNVVDKNKDAPLMNEKQLISKQIVPLKMDIQQETKPGM